MIYNITCECLYIIYSSYILKCDDDSTGNFSLADALVKQKHKFILIARSNFYEIFIDIYTQHYDSATICYLSSYKMLNLFLARNKRQKSDKKKSLIV